MSGTVEMARETAVGRKYSLCPHGAYPPECVQGGPVGGCTGDYRGLPEGHERDNVREELGDVSLAEWGVGVGPLRRWHLS